MSKFFKQISRCTKCIVSRNQLPEFRCFLWIIQLMSSRFYKTPNFVYLMIGRIGFL